MDLLQALRWNNKLDPEGREVQGERQAEWPRQADAQYRNGAFRDPHTQLKASKYSVAPYRG
jgi:hypothetical protein